MSVRSFIENLPKEEVIVLYGGSATGKTTLGLQLTVKALKEGKKVFFIDSEKTFSLERLRQILPSVDNYLDRLKLFKPRSFSEQANILESLPLHCGLIVIDSLSKYYRIELKKNHVDANVLAVQQLRRLHKFIDLKIPVILINQVYSRFSDDGVNPVGGNMLRRWSQILIRLDKEPRNFVIEKPSLKEFKFKIVDEGLVDI